MSDLQELERKAIQRLKSFEPEDGYYLCYSGGKDSDVIRILANLAGVKHDTDKKICDIMKRFGNSQDEVMEAYTYGLHHLDKYPRKVPDKDRCRTNKARSHGEKKVIAVSAVTGEDVAIFDSLTEASEHFGGYQSNITNAIHRNTKYKNFLWRYADV